MQTISTKKIPTWLASSGIFAIIVIVMFNALYTVEEGNVGILKTFGQATEQVGPGLHFKIPVVNSVEIIEIRTRKNVEQLPASSKEQMPLKVFVSLNWTVQKEQAMELYSNYGGLTQFEERIIDPKLRSASKDAMAKYTAEELIINRGSAIADIERILLQNMDSFPVKIDSIQIENIELPRKYLESIETKQAAKNLADAEKHKLEQQRLQAQQLVNTANAQRDAAKAAADGVAYRITTEATAEAQAIQLKGEAEARAIDARARALSTNQTLVEYQKALSWDGKMPTTVMGEGQSIMWNMNKN